MKQRTLLIFALSVFVFGCFYAWRDSAFKSRLEDAEEAYGRGGNDEALSDFLFASALDENSSENMRVRRAEIFLENGRADAARGELAKLLENRSRNAKAYELLGKIETAAGNYGASDGYYAKACSLGSGTEIFIARVKNLVRSGDFAGALRLLDDEGGNYGAEDVDYYRSLIKFNETGSCAEFSGMESGKHEGSIRLMEDSCRNLPENGNANPDYVLVRKADIFNRIGEPDFAFAGLQRVLPGNPEYCDALVELGKSYLIGNEYAKAAEAIEKCAALDANNKKAFFYLAGIYGQLGNGEKAAECEARYEYLTR